MSKTNDGSVAPEERVNIVYRPATGGAQEDVELPLKLLVAGDFTGAPDARPVEKREPVNVDKDTFNDVLKAQNVHVDIKVADKLSGRKGNELDVHLSFASIQDFSPERVAAQLPELKALMDMRDALSALKGPLANVPEFKSKIQSMIKDENARKKILEEMGIPDQEDHHG